MTIHASLRSVLFSLPLFIPACCHGQAAIFVGCGFFDGETAGAKAVEVHQDSGFDTVLLESHFKPDGAIYANREKLFDNGEWVSDSWRKDNLTKLIATVDRVEFWFAGWSRRDYDFLRKVKANKKATANLRSNLAALKQLGVCAYCDDDEDVYDTKLSIWMGRQIKNSGLLYTIAPYKRPEHWVPIVEKVGVDRVYYQAYHPGRKLAGWDQLKGDFWVGLNSGKDPLEVVQQKCVEFGKNPSVVGGFLWSHGIILNKHKGDYKSFSDAIKAGVNAAAPEPCAGDGSPETAERP
ncbi:MAG: hypothetical protein AAF589_01430 [Planctomycetota bacterium]